MNVIIKIFFLAVGWYLLLTLPTIIMPVMYYMSAIIMLAVCWIAGLLFFFLSQLIKDIKIHYRHKVTIIYCIAALTVAAAFQAVEAFGLWQHVWKSEGFLLFPLAAIAAAWIAMLMKRTELAEYMGKPNELELALQSINIEP